MNPKTCCSGREANPTTPNAKSNPSCCPVDGAVGKSVDWLTVAALSHGAVPERQHFWLCPSQDCEVVYFGEHGARIPIAELHVQPGFKAAPDPLVCYCFLHRQSDIARELEQTGSTTVLEAIKQKVQAGNCACEVRNPTGKCCLGQVQATIRTLQRQAEAPR